jgi:hypothetical protein
VPYVVGVLGDTPDSRFLQTLIYETDFNSYCSFVRQARDGAWLFSNQFTPERHAPAFFNLEFLVAGKLAASFGWSAGAALQVQRAGATVLFVLAVAWLGSLVLASARFRWLTVLALTSGGGFGWVAHLLGGGPLPRDIRPLDLFAGLHPFFWMLLQPHFLAAQLLSVVALACFLEAEAGSGRRFYPLAGLAAAACGLARPFDMLHLQALSVLYFLAMWRREPQRTLRDAWPRLLLALVPLPVLLYQFWLFRFHHVFSWWGRLNVVPPPSAWSLTTGMGLSLLFVILGAMTRPSAREPGRLFFATAALAAVTLLYGYPWLSFSLQFVTTLTVPAVLFAATSLEKRLLPLLEGKPGAAWALAALLLVNAFTSLSLAAQSLRDVRSGKHRIDGESAAILEWLRAHSAAGDVVMAGPDTSNRIPRFTPASVFCGYQFSTVDYWRKLPQQQRFYDARTRDVTRLRMIRTFGVRYVVHGAEERRAGYDPATSPFLAEVFRAGDAAVYEVRAGR